MSSDGHRVTWFQPERPVSGGTVNKVPSRRELDGKPFIEKVRGSLDVPGWRVTVSWVDEDEPQELTWQDRDEAFAYAHGIVRKYGPRPQDWTPLISPAVVRREVERGEWSNIHGWPS